MTLDPALRTALHAGLALLLLDAAVHKLRDLRGFREALAGYRIVPAPGVMPAALGLAAAELALVPALLAPGLGAAPALCAAALLVLYAAAIGVNLARGRRDIDCGCSSRALRGSLHGGLVARNLGLAGLALVAALPAGARTLHWVDGVTIAGAVAAGALLYAAADRALANAPRLSVSRVRA